MTLSLMIRDDMNLCQYTGPASQIPILVTAPPVRKINLPAYMKDFVQWQTFNDFYHDAPNSHVPDINFLEFLLHALSITKQQQHQQKYKKKWHKARKAS